MTPAALEDPLQRLNGANRYAIYAELRQATPVYRGSVHAGWVLTRYADVNAILKHPGAIALEVMPFLEALCRRGGLQLQHLRAFCRSLSLLTREPQHEAVRRVLGQALVGIRHINLPELLARRADELLDAGAARGSMDLGDGYGRALALFVIGTFLGIPEEDLPRLSEMARNFMAVFERTLPSVRALKLLETSAAALTGYFLRLLAARRKKPGLDGLSLIMKYADEQIGCGDDELAQNCLFFFIAAEETTSAAISYAALVLLQRPALRARLREDATLHKGAAVELLRLASPIQYIARQLRTDIEMGGHTILAGEPMILMLGAANRDPVAFAQPDDPILDRAGPKPLTFAAGPYSCVGAQLATLEVEIAVRKLLDRPALRLSTAPPVWYPRMNIAPLQRLEALFT